jgi:hypothetical protein
VDHEERHDRGGKTDALAERVFLAAVEIGQHAREHAEHAAEDAG